MCGTCEFYIQLKKNTLQPNRTVRTCIGNKAKDLKVKLVALLKEQQFVATITDCWSTFRKGYIGVTVHWIEKETLQRRSACLALRQLKGRHTFALEAIHKEFKLDGKINRTTTDSGSNFFKAFSVFGEQFDENMESLDELCNEEEEDVDASLEDLSGIEAVDVTGTFQHVNEDDDSGDFFLPRHQKCSCHLLNLIATKDAQTAESNASYKELSRGAFAICSALWNKFGRSTIAVEAVNDTLGLHLKRFN